MADQLTGPDRPAWLRFGDAIYEHGLSHDGDQTQARHVHDLVLKSDRFGERPTRDRSAPSSFIDAASTAMIGFDRAIAGEKP